MPSDEILFMTEIQIEVLGKNEEYENATKIARLPMRWPGKAFFARNYNLLKAMQEQKDNFDFYKPQVGNHAFSNCNLDEETCYNLFNLFGKDEFLRITDIDYQPDQVL